MQDPFSGRYTCICGSVIPDAREQTAVLDDHRQRLWAFDQLVKAAAECGVREDKDRAFVLLKDDPPLRTGPIRLRLAALGAAIRAFRATLPIVPLEAFGFNSEAADPFEDKSSQLSRLSGGVEALAFVDKDNSVYKFFLFREGGDVGATFEFQVENTQIFAMAVPGGYNRLLDKLRIIHEVGMPTELIGITPEGILVAKQTFGRSLEAGTDVSQIDPHRLISFPSRFLRADRDHPRLAFIDNEPWLLADTHDRNVVTDETGRLRIIDLVAAPLPLTLLQGFPLLCEWIERVRCDPAASLLTPVNDDEL
jgi:hypothetical protein